MTDTNIPKPNDNDKLSADVPVEGPVVDADMVEDIAEAIDLKDRATLLSTFEDMHPADIADVLEQVSPGRRKRAIQLVGEDLPSEALAELSEDVRAEALESLPDAAVVEALEEP